MIAKVKAWIADHFDLGAVEIKPFELLPAGHRVIDKHGREILVYYDILTDQIIYKERKS